MAIITNLTSKGSGNINDGLPRVSYSNANTRVVDNNPFLNRSVAFTNKFAIMDKMLNQMAEFLTMDEVDTIVKQMEIRTKSKLEGNWTLGDCIQFFKDTLGVDRYDTIRNLWILDNQGAIAAMHKPEDLKEIWIHKLTLREPLHDGEVGRSPDSYMLIKVPK
jgi:hypothetical protein